MKNVFSLKREERLRKEVDFQKVYSQGKCFQGDSFLFYVFKRSPDSLFKEKVKSTQGQVSGLNNSNRIGFVINKKVSKKAVTRNRVRRILREAYRLNKGKLEEGRDLALVAKRGAGELSFQEGQEALLQLFRKAGLIKTE